MQDYPIIERLYGNPQIRKYFQNKYPNTKIQSDAALIGITYAGTENLKKSIAQSNNIVLFPKTCLDISKRLGKKQKIKKAIKKILFLDRDFLEICGYIPNLYTFAKYYLVGLYYPNDRDAESLMKNILRMVPSLSKIPYSGEIISILSDTYGFTGSNFFDIAAFNEPWYYTEETKFIVMLRDPAEMVYAGYKNEYDRLYWNTEFEDIIDFQWIKTMVLKNRYPSFNTMIKKIHPLLYRGFHKEALQLWLKKYPNNKFFIISNQELKEQEEEVLNKISHVLNIPSFKKSEKYSMGGFSHEIFSFKPISKECKEVLDIFFCHYNQGLKSILDCSSNIVQFKKLLLDDKSNIFIKHEEVVDCLNEREVYSYIKDFSSKSDFANFICKYFEDDIEDYCDFFSVLLEWLYKLKLYGYILILLSFFDGVRPRWFGEIEQYKNERGDYDFSFFEKDIFCKDDDGVIKNRYCARIFCYHFVIKHSRDRIVKLIDNGRKRIL